ncbi:sensor histidine kinase [Paeniglutamicibacter sp. NPDC012692]|uniref:sensor histidine kinase n=1 Tax=Paeniglutamicibacter sp. NPDC012692 TaxID=3364388 RepID=UPI00367E6FD2
MVHTAYLGALETWQVVLSISATAAIGAALLFRRQHPVLVLVVVGVLALAKSAVGGPLDAGAIPLALYATAAYATVQTAWIALGTTLVATTTVLGIASLNTGSAEGGATTLIISLTLQVLAGLIGVMIGLRRRYQDALAARVQDARREREQRAELGRITERSSLSREMHDVVGHTLTAIINLSDGAETSFDTDPGLAREGLRRINEIARTALGETRTVVGALRGIDGAAPRTPQPDASRIPELLDTAEATGYQTTLVIDGQSIGDRSTQLSLYRIVQEAITNTMRHGKNATRIDVTISYAVDSITVQIHDDGEPQDTIGQNIEEHSHGQGLTGIHERAVLSGGTSTAGPAPGGGWHVTAVLRIPMAEHS